MRRFLTALLIALCCVCFAVGLTACGGNNGNGGNSGSTINGGGGSWGGWGGKPGNNGGGKQPGSDDLSGIGLSVAPGEYRSGERAKTPEQES